MLNIVRKTLVNCYPENPAECDSKSCVECDYKSFEYCLKTPVECDSKSCAKYGSENPAKT
jgi:hypothetical protein